MAELLTGVGPGRSLTVVLFLYLDKKFCPTLSVFTQLYDTGGKFNENRVNLELNSLVKPLSLLVHRSKRNISFVSVLVCSLFKINRRLFLFLPFY